MPQRKKTPQTGSADSEAVNWLELSDAEAPTLPRAKAWCNFPYFLQIRYPDLQPTPPSSSPTSQTGRIKHRLFKLEKQAFYETLSDFRTQIETHEEASRAVEDLTEDQQQQVAALLVDSITSFEKYKPDANFAKELKQLDREAPRRLRTLQRKIDAAHDSLQKLHDYASQLHWTLRGGWSQDHWHRWIDSKKASASCLEILEDVELPKPESFSGDLEDSNLHLNDPTSLYMVKFYWCFRHGCGLSGHESEVRVALIRNAFWTEWTTPVKYLPSYDTVDSQGCTAVRQAVRRFRP